MDVAKITERLAWHQTEAQRHLAAAKTAGESSEREQLALALVHVGEAQKHTAQATELLAKLQAIEASGRTMTAAEIDEFLQIDADPGGSEP